MTGYVRINTRPIPLRTTATAKAGEREVDVATRSIRTVGKRPAPAASGAICVHEGVEASGGP
jgi:hypothetical protein